MSNFGCYKDPNSAAIDCAVQGLWASVGGQEIFAFLVAGMLALGMYVASDGGLATPATVLTLTGSFLLTSLPAQYQSTAQVVIFVGLVSAIMALGRKYVMRT